MFCKYCGANCPDNAQICSACGSNLTMQQQPAQAAYQQAQPQQPQYQQPQYQQPQQPQYQQPQQVPYQPGQMPYPQPVMPAPGKGLAVAGLVLGIISFFCIPVVTGLLGIIFGGVAKSKGYRGGMATAGIVCGIIGIVGAILIQVLMPDANDFARYIINSMK